jgi:class 3 adenylate cyclase/tetratricopeptide (TPR) repeat protein
MGRPEGATTAAPSVTASPHDLRAYVADVQVRWLATDPHRREQTIPGTLVFADVSGFTPLTERLARRGRVGAERLTDVLNDVFGRLLGSAAAHGGDLLKFGGDALLLLFSGNGHEVRAAAAASAMQDDLRPFRRLRTEAGTVSLRMSVGAASGDIEALMVGRSHRELLVIGPVVSETARLEGAASAGEILLSTATATALPAESIGRSKDGGVLLRSAPPDLRVASRAEDVDVDCSIGVPESIRPYLRGGSDEGEHRLAVVAFVQFKGTDELLAADGISAVARALDELVAAAQEACAEHGVALLGTDLDRNGGKLLLAAGAPVATADDEDRMLFALRDIAGLETPLAVRAGVNRGYAFAVDMGSPARRTYTVMGDAVNLAARVMGRAERGQVLATRAVLDRVSTPFALDPLEPFTVKGKSQPVAAAVVGEPTGRRRRARDLPLFGRDAELGLLRRALTSARDGRGSALEIVGEPGVGKSRLVTELVATEADVTIVEINGGVYARNSPYFALRAPTRALLGVDASATNEAVEAALRQAVAASAPQLEPWLPLLDVLVGLELAPTPEIVRLDPRFRAVRLHAVAADLFDALIQGTAVVWVDDAQWLDDASSALLSFLLNSIDDRSWLACICRRLDVAGGLRAPDVELAEGIALAGVDDDAAASIVHQVAADADVTLAPHVRDAIVERAGGSPLLLAELTSSAAGGQDLAALPDSIEGVLAARVDVLAPADRTVLRRVAVLGARMSRDHFAAMSGLGGIALDDAIDRLRGFIEPDERGGLRFRQSIVREVAYANLSFRRRRELHAQAAALVREAAGDDLAEWSGLLSLHYSEAHQFAEAWHHARVAGARAKANAAPLDAAAFFTRALAAARQLDDVPAEHVAEVSEQLGEVAELGGRYDVAATAYAQARRLRAHDPVDVARLCGREGRLRERSGRATEALGWFTKGQRTLDRAGVQGLEADELRADLVLRYAGTRLRQGRAAASLSLLEEVVRRAIELRDKPLLAHAYYLLDWAHSDLGNPDAQEYRALALPIYEELDDHASQANVLNNLGVSAYFEGRWEEALTLYERSRAARERAGDLVEMGTAENNVAEILSDQGHLERAEERFHRALEIWRPAAFHVGVGIATSNLGRAAARAGRTDEAEALLRDATERLTKVGAESLALEALAREVERRVLVARTDALVLAEEVAARASRLGGQGVLLAMVDRLCGYALAQAGDRAAGLDFLRSGLDRASRASAPFEIALTLEALGRVDPGTDEAMTAAAAAVDRFATLGVVSTPTVPLPVD